MPEQSGDSEQRHGVWVRVTPMPGPKTVRVLLPVTPKRGPKTVRIWLPIVPKPDP
jgi:hypothetical protein